MEKLAIFNLNYTVLVKFTTFGFAQLLIYLNRHGLSKYAVSLEQMMDKCDGEGYYPMQGHDLINAMGGHIGVRYDMMDMNVKLSPEGLKIP